MREMGLPSVVALLQRHEKEIHMAIAASRVSPQIKRQLKDQAARSGDIATITQKYHERMNGVVRATNPNF